MSQPRNIAINSGYEVTLNLFGNTYKFFIREISNNFYLLKTGKQQLFVEYIKLEKESALKINNQRYSIQITTRADDLQCEIDGIPYLLKLESKGWVKSPSPAIVLNVAVKPDQEVQKGDLLISLEAMKMEILVNAPQDGIVKSIMVQTGHQITAGQPLIQLDSVKEGADEIEETQPRIEFKHLGCDNIAKKWQLMEWELLGLFLGYDYDSNIRKKFNEILEFVKNHSEYQARLIFCLQNCLEIYCLVESLFSQQKLSCDSFSTPVSTQELFIHFFRRKDDRKKGLPEEFLSCLEKLMQWYPCERK